MLLAVQWHPEILNMLPFLRPAAGLRFSLACTAVTYAKCSTLALSVINNMPLSGAERSFHLFCPHVGAGHFCCCRHCDRASWRVPARRAEGMLSAVGAHSSGLCSCPRGGLCCTEPYNAYLLRSNGLWEQVSFPILSNNACPMGSAHLCLLPVVPSSVNSVAIHKCSCKASNLCHPPANNCLWDGSTGRSQLQLSDDFKRLSQCKHLFMGKPQTVASKLQMRCPTYVCLWQAIRQG